MMMMMMMMVMIYEVVLLSMCGCTEYTFIRERHDSKENLKKGDIQND
jgi:hypothetical protein